MNSRTDSVQPPRIALWLVTLFASNEDVESILGDLLEEFASLASKSGMTAARSWYWRQTAKTIAHLAAAGVRAAPWQTAASVAAGFLLMLFGSTLAAHATRALFNHYGIPGFYGDGSELGWHIRLAVTPYTVWIARGLILLQVLIEGLVGVVVATASKGREMTTTLALGLFMIALRVAGNLLMVVRTGDYTNLQMLPWAFVGSLAIVAGGAIVRRRRSASASRASAPRPSAS